jgi:hypothetical protein
MSTTTLIKSSTRSGVDDQPSFGEMLEEILPLIGVVVFAGPPVVLLAGPLVFGALMLTGPFALAVTLVLAVVIGLIAVTALIALTRAVAGTPHILLDRLRARRGRRTNRVAPARRVVTAGPRRGAA